MTMRLSSDSMEKICTHDLCAFKYGHHENVDWYVLTHKEHLNGEKVGIFSIIKSYPISIGNRNII